VGFTDRKTSHGVARKIEVHKLPRAFTTEIIVRSTLHYAKQ
jgi:hypothetical protein